MKTTTIFSIASIALLQFANAQPLKHAHARAHQKKAIIDKRTEVDVFIYVDGEGLPVSTSITTLGLPTSTSTASSSTSSSSSSSSSTTSSSSSSSTSSSFSSTVLPATTAIPTPVSSSVPTVVVTPTAASTTVAATSTAPVATPSSNVDVSSSSGFGIAYSPYNAGGTCKTQAQVSQDFSEFGSEFAGGMVRSYGTDCNQVATILEASKPYNMKLFLGIFDLSTIPAEVATIVSAVAGDWSRIAAVSVGNELVNNGAASAASIVSAISQVRSLLEAAGSTVPVVTVDTLVATRENPSIADASDFVAVNCHPFFDPNTDAASAGSFITTQMESLKAVLSDQSKKIVVTETGWPWQGTANGQAVPSKDNQATAMSSIKTAFSENPENVILFTPFNDYWKTNSASLFNAEQFWGFKGDSPSG